MSTLFELVVNEGLEELQSHCFWQSTLMQLEFRPHDDNGTSGVIDSFSQQVLPKTSLLTFKHVAQGFQWTLVRAPQGTAAAAIVEERVHGFLQHTLFIANDDFWSAQLLQPDQPIVSVDDPAIQVVQVRGGETSPVQWHQWPQLWRNDGYYFQDHPFGPVVRFTEGLNDFQPFDDFLAFLQRHRLMHL